MTAPRPTVNPATTSVPARSSKRVARKSPLGWLPWALLALLALLVALILLVVNAIDDDGPDGPAGDSLGQVGSSDGAGINGADGQPGGEPAAGPSTGGDSAGAPAAGAPAAGADLAGLTPAGLVGGAGVRAAPASAVPATLAKRDAGTAGTVLFAEGSADLDGQAQAVIAQAVEGLKAARASRVTVSGYTDVIAGQDVNDPLSQERADAVARALGAALPGVQITTEARGQDRPVAPNSTEQGRQQNRRAAIVATA